VIGILDALKHESNVAGWIRDGQVRVRAPVGYEGAHTRTPGSGTVEVGVDVERQIDDTPPTAMASTSTLRSAPPPTHISTTYVPGLGVAPSPTPTSMPSLGAGVGADPTSSECIPDAVSNNPDLGQQTQQWYEDPDTVARWVQRGVRALEELDIEVNVGIER